MGKIVFDIKKDGLSADTKCSLKEIVDALPAIHQSLLIDLSKILPQKDSIAVSFLAFLSAMDEMEVPQDVMFAALNAAVIARKEACEDDN